MYLIALIQNMSILSDSGETRGGETAECGRPTKLALQSAIRR